MKELCLPDWPVGPQINQACCTEAGLCAAQASGGSIRLRWEAIEDTEDDGGLVGSALLDRSLPTNFSISVSERGTDDHHGL
jgi:hypothetical protein